MLWLTLFSALSFFYYGASCLVDPRMRLEFERYGLARYCRLTGVLQLFGAVGLLIGLFLPSIGVIATVGLALQMLLAVGVRLRIGDGWLRACPALLYLLANAVLAVAFYGLI